MATKKYEYPATLVQQNEEAKPLILFGARAVEIEEWAGIPQRGRMQGSETSGFQREENKSRVNDLSKFFANPANVVQNPLLCAVQDSEKVQYTPYEFSVDGRAGKLIIEKTDFDSFTLKQLVDAVIERLESRLPDLGKLQLESGRFNELREQLQLVIDDADPSNELIEDPIEQPIDDEVVSVDSVLSSEETQIADFYRELRYRSALLAELDGEDDNQILGFTRDAMISYLQPAVIVDGQHRLKGAVKAAKDDANSSEGQDELVELIDQGVSPDEALQRVLAERSRLLPVSLLMNDSPSEHVFQFVVVNQKATPMGKALLGTIVSTSLSREELEPITDRLKAAGVKLEDSQAVAYLTRHPDSPFRGLVNTGIRGDQPNALGWNVLKGLVSIFRELEGGKLYGDPNDYAKVWRRKYLAESGYVIDKKTPEEQFAEWSRSDGPWRDVFIEFFTLVKDKFGDDDLSANNSWGSTASNLYNQVSLTILASDFFQYLVEHKLTLSSTDDVEVIFDDWLDGVNNGYFSRDWRLGGLKKAQRPVQEKWADVWQAYRKNPERLPDIRSYRPVK
ncbi:hypothetical protein GQF49_00635 [Microbacter sp. ANSKLAB05]|nr:hypothetical protein [Microbacter sp. ANSKLAB05]